jgi:hypothetical protein
MTGKQDFVHAKNAKAWAVGEQRSNGFEVRRVVWGRLAATYERRIGEQIRQVIIMVRKRK